MTAPAQQHPGWCDRQHSAEWPVHSVQIGADLELTGELSYAVLLFQVPDKAAEVHLLRHTPEETTVTAFSVVEASILRDLLSEGVPVDTPSAPDKTGSRSNACVIRRRPTDLHGAGHRAGTAVTAATTAVTDVVADPRLMPVVVEEVGR